MNSNFFQIYSFCQSLCIKDFFKVDVRDLLALISSRYSTSSACWKKLVYIIFQFTLCQYLTRAPAIHIYFSKNLSLAHITRGWKKQWIIVARIDSSRMLRIAERISPKTSEALFKPIHYLKAEENQSKHINECTYSNFVHEFIKSQENPLLLKEDIFLASQNAFRHKVHIL